MLATTYATTEGLDRGSSTKYRLLYCTYKYGNKIDISQMIIKIKKYDSNETTIVGVFC